ncbi:hypothetical protein B0H17DRAFT_1206938 [Mycena rosella]|uniref:Uncharacterized protein n=1 Tax=Mycena rosella TaxID=1033263 RepID=A0AAD7GB06_MYCRO|nr:hypothetical protein B0H17DRAFT_1206938 [Mycena rosella]
MQFKSLLVTFILSAGIVTGLTLPEAVEEEQGQCGRPDAVCFLNNPGTCCSGNCCCGFDSDSESGCSFTPCSPAQQAGTQPGHALARACKTSRTSRRIRGSLCAGGLLVGATLACTNTPFAFAGGKGLSISSDDVLSSPCFPPPPRACTSIYRLPTRTRTHFLSVVIATADLDAEFTVGRLPRSDLFGRRTDGSPLPASSRCGVESLGASSPFGPSPRSSPPDLPASRISNALIAHVFQIIYSHRKLGSSPFLLPPHPLRILHPATAAPGVIPGTIGLEISSSFACDTPPDPFQRIMGYFSKALRCSERTLACPSTHATILQCRHQLVAAPKLSTPATQRGAPGSLRIDVEGTDAINTAEISRPPLPLQTSLSAALGPSYS